jgi:hypothetical protein
MKVIDFAKYPKFIDAYLTFLDDKPKYINSDPLEVLAQLGIKSAVLMKSQFTYQKHERYLISDEDYTWFLLRWS